VKWIKYPWMQKIQDLFVKWIAKIKKMDQMMMRHKIYQWLCVVLFAVITVLLISSYNIISSVSNYSNLPTNSIRLEQGIPIRFSFEAKKTKMSSFYLYKDMKSSRLSKSDKAEVTISSANGNTVFNTEVFLYDQNRNYIIVNCADVALAKGEKYTVTFKINNFSSGSYFYLTSHETNTFDSVTSDTVLGDVPVGLSQAPNVSFNYSVLSFAHMIPHLIYFAFFIAILFVPKIIQIRWVKEVYRGVFICSVIYLIQEVLNIAKPDPMQLFFPFSAQHFFILMAGLLILFIFYLIVYAISGNGTFAIFFMGVLALVIGYINHFKIVMRGDPAVPWDLYSAGIAAKISSKYQFHINLRFVASIFMVIFLMVIIRLTHTPTVKGFRIRIAATFCSVLLMAGLMFGVVLNQDLLKKMDISYSLFPPLQSFNENGTMLALALHLNNIPAGGSDNNSPEATEDLVQKYVDLAKQLGLNNTSADTNTVHPNVICVMSESYSNLSEIRNIETSEPVMPYFTSLMKDTMHGDLQVSIFGGGTCNTEFEFLTGYSVRSLLAGASVYSLYVNHSLDALPQIFKDQGYKTLAIHPFDRNWWDRDKAYPLLGFDQFISDVDFVNPEYVRGYISDKSAFERVISEYENKTPDQPMFTFLVTMQNHADYSKYWDNEAYNIKITNFPDETFTSTEHYLSLLRQSDDALKELISYFSTAKEPTIIVFFGDHKPFLDSNLYSTLLGTDLSQITARESLPMYTTPYFIWANYNIQKGDVGITSPNILGQKILDLAGLKSPDERACLQVLMTKISAMSALAVFDKEESAYTSDDALPPDISSILKDYEFIEYGKLFLENSIVDNSSNG